jgi:hypothetical protein
VCWDDLLSPPAGVVYRRSASLRRTFEVTMSIHDKFSDEEKQHLSYLGTALRREPTDEEVEQQRLLDWHSDIPPKDEKKD